ncbi:MAG: hypothetical protein AAB472_03550 [Patescibacteria group bacterium]
MDIVIPITMGIMIFKERRQFGPWDIVFYVLGIIGFLLVLFGS